MTHREDMTEAEWDEAERQADEKADMDREDDWLRESAFMRAVRRGLIRGRIYRDLKAAVYAGHQEIER